ncbi:GNAT family N-acetyltransferase [Streptomyces sp. NPDC096339]|uniref:GNAT family N-acetyltransferase n=1 Tax=Streptomyces sp. NPDC096339 TaxID=3366086 RepID=UPI0038297A27
MWRIRSNRPAPVPVRCGDGRHVLHTARLVLFTPRDVLDMEIGRATGADAVAQRWLGWPVDTLVNAETAEHLLGIDDGNRTERLRAFPAPMRRELILPTPPPGPGLTQWLVAVDRATGRVAGASSLTPAEDGSLGLQLAPAYRGQGLGTEVVAATARFGHAHFGLRSVRAGAETSNDNCRRALDAAGFEPCDGPSRHTLPDGRVIDSAWYRHTADGTSHCASVRASAAARR